MANIDPMNPIGEFLDFFEFEEEHGSARLIGLPQPWLLEYMASCFSDFLKTGLPLEEAFSLKAPAKGKLSPREMYNKTKRDEEIVFVLYPIYLQEEQDKSTAKRLYGDEKPSERAIRRIAEEKSLSFDYVRKIILNPRKIND